MLSKKMVKSLNEQINKELYSAYLYLAMASYSAVEGLNGFANWFNVQVKEELTHAERFYKYVNQQGGKVELEAIDKPPAKFTSPVDLFDKTLKHEQKVTKMISSLVALARKENDYATEAALQWFVTEQVEEESNVTENLQKMKIVGKDGNGILTIDSQLAARVFVPPVAAKAA